MSLLSATCMMMLRAASPCSESDSPPAAILSADPVSDGDLAAIRGQGLPLVGLDQTELAGEANEVAIASFGPLASQTLRELTDNWNLTVAVPLIAEATAAR